MDSSGLERFLCDHPRLFVLTGAGVSTGSGIPGYRDIDGNWRRKPPVTHQEFIRSETARKRYWARSLIGWPAIAAAVPNAAHAALATFERLGRVSRLVTQNVDGLHQRAGSRSVLDLHGRLDQVVCLGCGTKFARGSLQTAMQEANPTFANVATSIAPDGDADAELDFEAFAMPQCTDCGGMLKPDVVFFGDGVPRSRVEAAFEALDGADAVLIVGSSLMAYSGYRFCERACELRKPVVAINRGRTRADDLLRLKIDADCVTTLTALVGALTSVAH